MKFTLAEQIGLIYTSAGSLRNVSKLTGISHQKLGRILRGESSERVLSDPGLKAAIGVGLRIHTDVARSQARVDGLPFNGSLPVYYSRLPMKVWRLVPKADRKTGEILLDPLTGKELKKRVAVIDPSTGKQKIVPGDRIGALNTHHLTDRVRNSWIQGVAKTKKFYAASVGSIVNLSVYKKRGDAAQKGMGKRSDRQKENLNQIVERINTGAEVGAMFTKYTPLDFPGPAIVRDITQKLAAKHEPATGTEGTILANQILLQLDTRFPDGKIVKPKPPRDATARKKKTR